ncbi:hypothetical protein EMIT0111MI5_120196 [Burkholderia sp. IT-111MI5]
MRAFSFVRPVLRPFSGAWLRGGGSRLRGFRRDSKGCACKSGAAPLREIRDCIRTRLRYRGGMRS